jgi:hypothetical protein
MTNIEPSWRDANTVHPLADKLPMLSPDELQERPARTDHDGRGRRQATTARRPQPFRRLFPARAETEDGNGRRETHQGPPTLAAYITSLNVHRRHLTPEQKATALRDLIIASPEKSGGRAPVGSVQAPRRCNDGKAIPIPAPSSNTIESRLSTTDLTLDCGAAKRVP